MTESSNINPDFIFKSKLTPTINMKNPKSLSFCNSEFNPQIAKVTEKDYEITFGNTQAQDSDEFSFLKSSEMINIPCSKPIFSISQIDEEDDDDDESSNLTMFEMGAAASSNNNAIESNKDVMVSWIISDYTTANLDDCCSRNSIGLTKEMGTNSNESGRFGASASLVPMKVKVEDHVIPVRKSADAPGRNANMPNNGNVYGNGNAGNTNGVGAVQPNNGVNNGAAAANNNGDVGGHDNGYLNANGNFGQGITIFRLNANLEPISGILTNIVPMHHGTWEEFAGSVHQYWQIDSGQATVQQLAGVAPVPMPPADCWPGRTIVFGRVDGATYAQNGWGDLRAAHYTDLSWRQNNWLDVRAQINCACLIPLVHNYNNNNNNNNA